RFGLIRKRLFDERDGNLAVRFHQASKRTDIAKDEALTRTECLSRQSSASYVDLTCAVRLVMTVEHNSRCSERVGDEAIRSGVHISPLDSENAIRLIDVPCFAAASRMKARLLQLRSHCAVAQQDTRSDCFKKCHADVLRNVQPARLQRMQGFSAC